MRRNQVHIKFFTLLMSMAILLSVTGCGASFSEKDLAACQSAWDNTSDALMSAPRATYSDSAPDPTFAEVTRHYEDLLDSQSELISLASTVENSQLQVALMDFALGTGKSALDFLNNPRGRGTPGITKFNDTFKVVIDLCESAGWKRQ